MRDSLKILWLNVLVIVLFLVDRFFKKAFVIQEAFFTNENIAFGLELDMTMIYILTGVILFLMLGWLIYLYRKNLLVQILGLSLMIGGATSNLIDRVKLGHVIDYINFPYFSIFNLADVMIVVGACILIFIFLKKE